MNASGELDSTGAIDQYKTKFQVCLQPVHIQVYHSVIMIHLEHLVQQLNEFIQDTVGLMFSSNTETNITVGYEDGDGTIDLAVEQQLNNTSAPYYHKIVVTVSGGKFLLDGGSQQTQTFSMLFTDLTNQIHQCITSFKILHNK